MTLGIAMVTPWGLGRKIQPHLPMEVRSPGGIAMAIDSRYSAGQPSRKVRDDGAKMWFPAPGIIAILAGCVDVAELGLERATKELRANPIYEAEPVAALVAGAFKAAIPHHWRKGQYTCHIVVGVAGPTGDAYLVRLESEKDFRPQIGIEDQVIGDERLVPRFWADLRSKSKLAFDDLEIGQAEGLDIVIDPGSLATTLGAAVKLVSETSRGTAGGPVQLAYAIGGTTHGAGLYRADESMRFEEVTASRIDVRGTGGRGRERLRRFPSDDA